MKRGVVMGSVLILSMIVASGMISCGGGGGSSSGFSGTTKTIVLGPQGQDIPLTAGEPYSFAFSVNFDVGRYGGPYTYLILDLEDNFSGLTFAPAAAAALEGGASPLGVGPATVTFYVDTADAADPCATGTKYGPFEVALDAFSQPESVTPETASVSQETLEIINQGAFSVCVVINSPVDATASQDEATLQICDEIIADISGAWAGTYSCSGGGELCEIADDNVYLTITQVPGSPWSASYSDDGGAFYTGNVCGYTFSFDGGVTGSYDESGIFIMDPGGLTATKTSHYDELFGPCSGNCSDVLTRVAGE